MLGMDQYEMIRAAHRKYGKGIRVLAREFGHHRKTIRKILAREEPRNRREREVANPVMDRVAGVLHKWLEEGLENPKKQRHTVRPPGILRSAESAGARRAIGRTPGTATRSFFLLHFSNSRFNIRPSPLSGPDPVRPPAPDPFKFFVFAPYQK